MPACIPFHHEGKFVELASRVSNPEPLESESSVLPIELEANVILYLTSARTLHIISIGSAAVKVNQRL